MDVTHKKVKALVPVNGNSIQAWWIIKGTFSWPVCPVSVNNVGRIEDLMGCHFSYFATHPGHTEEHLVIKC